MFLEAVDQKQSYFQVAWKHNTICFVSVYLA